MAPALTASGRPQLSDLRSLIEELVAAGLDPIDAADIIARAALVGAASVRVAIQETPEERRRRVSRETSARHRASQNVTSASPCVTVTGDAKTSPSVTDASPSVTLARVEDITPRLVISGNHTTLDSASALTWPETEKPSRSDLDALEAALRQAAGAAINLASPALLDLSPILRLARGGKGEPCDLSADVLPTIRARSAKAPPGSVKAWGYFTDAICEARDRRLSGAPAGGDVVAIRGTGPPNLVDRITEERAEARRLAFARMDAQNG